MTNLDLQSGRAFTRAAFNEAYRDVILGNRFHETPSYYLENRPRYRDTLARLAQLPLPRPARVLEVGGGQIALLCRRMFGDEGMVADVSEDFAESVTRYGIGFARCNLLYDDLPDRDAFDAVVLCEVVEHLPVPLHLVLEKIKRWIRPGGYLFLTTPNLYRLRNLVRLALGLHVFGAFFYPEPGRGIGHPFEYSTDHLTWHMRKAGFENIEADLVQLIATGATPLTKVLRFAARPLALRPLWRDCIVASGRKPETAAEDAPATPVLTAPWFQSPSGAK